MTLIELLKTKNEHGLINSIFNEGLLNPVGVMRVLKLCAEENDKSHIDLGELIKADYDRVIVSSIEKYLNSKKELIIKKLDKKARKKIVGELDECYIDQVSCMYGNNEIITMFGHLSFVYGLENDRWVDLDETSDYITGKEFHLDSESIEIIINL